MRYIKLIIVEDSYQAHFIDEALAAEGIRCIIAHENSAALMPFYTGILGGGVEIRVAEVDHPKAQEILASVKKTDEIRCPNCDSLKVDYGVGEKRWLLRVLGTFLSLFTFALTTRYNFIYRCLDCGTEFRKRKI